MLSKEAQKEIKSYLKKVRAATMDRGVTEQRELLQSLEEHIHEAIESGAGDHPTLEDVRSVTAAMDPPESYGGETAAAGGFAFGRINASNIGTVALFVLLAAIVIPLIGFVLEGMLPRSGDIANPTMLIGIVLLLVALVFGIIGRRQPAGKATMIASIVLLAALTVIVPVNRVSSQGDAPAEIHLEAPSSESR